MAWAGRTLKVKLRKQGPPDMSKVLRVSTAEATRFLGHAKEPFETRALHPVRSATNVASEKIDRRADTDRHGNAEAAIMHGHPFFSLGTAEGDEQQVGTRSANAFDDFVMVHVEQRAKWRRVVSGNDNARVQIL